MTATLGELAVGACGTIIALQKTAACYRRKLLAMGLIPGTRFTVCRVAPLGDPMQLQVRGGQLSIRRDEAATVAVSVETASTAMRHS